MKSFCNGLVMACVMVVSQLASLAFGEVIYENDNDEEVFAFGKHKGETVRSVFRKERNYYDWMMKAEFPLYTKKVITQIYEAEYLKDFGKII